MGAVAGGGVSIRSSSTLVACGTRLFVFVRRQIVTLFSEFRGVLFVTLLVHHEHPLYLCTVCRLGQCEHQEYARLNRGEVLA